LFCDSDLIFNEHQHTGILKHDTAESLLFSSIPDIRVGIFLPTTEKNRKKLLSTKNIF
jgi:hypothetical protein